MKAKIKLSKDAIHPKRSTIGAAGYDLWTNEECIINIGETKVVKTGVFLQIEAGYEAQVRPRSGNSKKGVFVHKGTIDSDFIGEIKIIITNFSNEILEIEKHSRMAQLVFAKVEYPEFTNEPFELTERGENGFNSTGIK